MKYLVKRTIVLLISGFRRVLNIVCVLLGIYQHRYINNQTPLTIHTSYLHPALEDGTDRGFRNVGRAQTDAGDIPKRTHTTDNSCFPNVAGIEVKVKVDNCRRRARDDMPVPVRTVCKEELSELHAKGCDMVTEMPKYNQVKTRLVSERNTEDSSKIVFSEEVLHQANNSSFLRFDHTDDSAKIILVFAGGRL